MLVFAGLYMTSGRAGSRDVQLLGASARPPAALTHIPTRTFESTHTGSGGVFLPTAQPAIAAQVSVDPGVAGPWFWCFESSFGLPLAEHYCAASEPGYG